MKKFLLATLVALLGSGICIASDTAIPTPATESAAPSPQVCKFSLSSYAGTINVAFTQKFKVGLSCPQQEDVRATVEVIINGEVVASKVVTISAGEVYSGDVSIYVGSSYRDKPYRLSVQ